MTKHINDLEKYSEECDEEFGMGSVKDIKYSPNKVIETDIDNVVKVD